MIYDFEKIEKKKSENFPDFRGDDGPSNRFFDRASTFSNFLRLDRDSTNRDHEFKLYDNLVVACARKLIGNYEKLRQNRKFRSKIFFF